MMNEMLRILLTGTIAGSGLFAMVLVLNHMFHEGYIEQILYVAKGVLFFYLISVLPVYYVAAGLARQVEVQVVNSEDFYYLERFEGMKNLETVGAAEAMSMLLAMVWMGVFAILIIRFIIKNHIFSKKLLAMSVLIDDERFDLFLKCKKELIVKRNIELYECSLISSPILIGITQPKIMLPIKGEYNLEEWEMFLKHEMCHFKNHDLYYRLYLEIVQCIHWFNPVIYSFVYKFYEISELVCDSRTVSGYGLEKRICYARLINKAMEEKPSIKTLASFSGSYKRAERRIFNIMKRKKHKNNIVFSLAVVVFLILCPIISYAAARAVNHSENVLVNKFRSYYDNEERAITVDERVTTDFVNINSIEAVESAPRISRGSNVINNLVISATGEAYFSSVNLENGSKVKIGVISGNSNDKYIGGVVDSRGKRYYVNATNGVLGHSFTVSESGSYRVFFEGKNGSGGSDICLNGTITIEY